MNKYSSDINNLISLDKYLVSTLNLLGFALIKLINSVIVSIFLVLFIGSFRRFHIATFTRDIRFIFTLKKYFQVNFVVTL